MIFQIVECSVLFFIAIGVEKLFFLFQKVIVRVEGVDAGPTRFNFSYFLWCSWFGTGQTVIAVGQTVLKIPQMGFLDIADEF
jgi:hypothetical protein